MSEKQSLETPTVRIILTTGTTIRPLAINSHGLHYKPPDI